MEKQGPNPVTHIIVSVEEVNFIHTSLVEIKSLLTKKQDAERLNERLSLNAAAKIMGLSSRTVRRLKARREIPFYQVGKLVFLKRLDIEEYMSRHYIKQKQS
jgi:excisionase family DNA binding protein